MNINSIFEEYSSKGTKLEVRMLNKDMILIEGDSEALEFFGRLLISLAKSDSQNSIQIGPKVAGSNFFTPSSTKGIYFHKTKLDKTGSMK